MSLIRRALDIGADCIAVPWIETEDMLRQAVAYAHYPPRGRRWIGSERATCWGQSVSEHVAEADEHVMVVPIVESVAARRSINQMLELDGVDVFFFGPLRLFIYSRVCGAMGGATRCTAHPAGEGSRCGYRKTPRFAGHKLRESSRALPAGVPNARPRISDSGLLLYSLHKALDSVGRDSKLSPGLMPDDE